MEEENLKAFISEEELDYQRGDKKEITTGEEVKNVIIRNVYPRRLEDLTFNDLEMMGYTNPNVFVKDQINIHGKFDSNKVVWVVVYVEDKKVEVVKC